MADKKISELPAATAPTGTELIEIVQGGVNKQTTTQDIASLGGGGGTWGSITGTLSNQTDLVTAIDAKVANSITNGVTTSAPNQDQVFDALALKAALTDFIGVQDLFIPASAMWSRVTSGCSVLTQYEIATSLFNIQGLEFSNTVQQFAQFQLVLPRKWNNSTVTAVVYWKPLASGSGDVQWGISGGAYSNDDALTVALGTPQTVDDTFIATDDLHVTSATSAITLAGTPADADFLALQISRNPGSDTLDVNAVLLGISIRITTDAGKDA